MEPTLPLEKSGNNLQLQQVEKVDGVTIEIISDIPVYTIENPNKDTILQIVASYGKESVIRIINVDFVEDAIEFGTDKKNVEEYDYRKVASGSGYDVWGIEKKALNLGYSKSDVFCGTDSAYFLSGSEEYTSRGLGFPEDRSAILIFDAQKLGHVEETDGYIFLDTKNKKSALLGVIKFKQILTEFEKEIIFSVSVDEKIHILENEVNLNLNNKADLKKAPLVSLRLIALLKQESIELANNLDSESDERIKKLKAIADRLAYKIRMIGLVDNMVEQVKMVQEVFKNNDTLRMERMKSWPDFVIETTEGYLQNEELEDKYKQELLEVIVAAKQCKTDYKL